jgi:hypothetical protein
VNSGIENSSHREVISDNYVEWWYFDINDGEGRSINGVLHETDIFGEKRVPYMSLGFRQGENSHRMKLMLGRQDITVAGRFLNTTNNMINEDEFGVNMNVNFSDTEEFHGRIDKLSKPFVIDQGILGQQDCKTSNWVVQIPHGIFHGELQMGSDIHHVEGFAYQDHQWGDLPIQNFVRDWVWGHFSNRNMSVIFFDILTQDNSLIQRVGIIRENHIEKAQSLKTDYLDHLILTDRPDLLTLKTDVNFFDGHGSLSLGISSSRLMRRRIAENHGEFNASYLRWASQAMLTIDGQSASMNGITEYMSIENEQ